MKSKALKKEKAVFASGANIGGNADLLAEIAPSREPDSAGHRSEMIRIQEGPQGSGLGKRARINK